MEHLDAGPNLFRRDRPGRNEERRFLLGEEGVANLVNERHDPGLLILKGEQTAQVPLLAEEPRVSLLWLVRIVSLVRHDCCQV